LRDSSHAPDTRAGMTEATASEQNHRNFLLPDAIGLQGLSQSGERGLQMKWRVLPVRKVTIVGTAGVAAVVLGCALVGNAQSIFDDLTKRIFPRPQGIASAEPVGLPYRFLQNGFPDDWSHHQLVFSAPSSQRKRQLLEREPRYWIQQLRGHWQPFA